METNDPLRQAVDDTELRKGFYEALVYRYKGTGLEDMHILGIDDNDTYATARQKYVELACRFQGDKIQ